MDSNREKAKTHKKLEYKKKKRKERHSPGTFNTGTASP